MPNRLLIFDSRVVNLVTHRQPIIRTAVELGFEVHVCTLVHGDTSVLSDLPVHYHRIGPDRRLGGLGEISLIWKFRRLVTSLRPTFCHFMSIRAVLYGLLSIQFTACQKTVSSITGLGFLFIDSSRKTRVIRQVFAQLIRCCTLRGRHEFVFQNENDLTALQSLGVGDDTNSHLIRGSGVDIERFAYRPLPEGHPVVLFPGRYLTHKGLVEFVEAAKLVRATRADIEFHLAGSPDPNNPASIDAAWLAEATDAAIVNDLGYQSDMVNALVRATIVCLPSYREGLPKALLEGAAVGRPLLSFDVPGCREVIDNGDNGFLVAAKSATALAEAILKMTDSDFNLERMGTASREMVEGHFSAMIVGRQFSDLYKKLL